MPNSSVPHAAGQRRILNRGCSCADLPEKWKAYEFASFALPLQLLTDWENTHISTASCAIL